MSSNFLERLQRTREEIPEKYQEAYDEITGQGKSPKSVEAAICYIETEATQERVSEIHGVSDVTIRKVTRDLIDVGAVDFEEVRKNNKQNGDAQFGEHRATGEKMSWKPE